MLQHAPVLRLLNIGLWLVIAGCDEINPQCAWLVLNFDDCPVAVINCPESPYYGPMPDDPQTNGYNLVAAFGECTNYGSSTRANGVMIQATTDRGCISEQEMVFTLCVE